MPIPVEKILPGKCYRFEGPPRRVLIMQDKRVTFVVRDKTAWTVLRYHTDLDTFAREAESVIDCTTLKDLPEE